MPLSSSCLLNYTDYFHCLFCFHSKQVCININKCQHIFALFMEKKCTTLDVYKCLYRETQREERKEREEGKERMRSTGLEMQRIFTNIVFLEIYTQTCTRFLDQREMV